MTKTLELSQLQYGVNLAEYTTWRVGGPAEQFYKPANLKDLTHFLSHYKQDNKMTWLGLGSNVLISDEGIKGLVIHTQGSLTEITLLEPHIIRAEAGVACGQLARHTARLNLAGLEFMAGVPGSVGGALAMNAGCHGSETWEYVQAVETIDRYGKIRLRSADEFKTGYRSVERPTQEWFVAGHFQLQSGDKQLSLEKIRVLLDKRNATQPTNEPNCGSVFRNPPENFAARLIEECGLKGHTIGGAQVSHKHANFIINTGTATANDIRNLIEFIQQEVLTKRQIHLMPEVHFLS